MAAVPLLWIVPLILYLLTFILAFARRPLLSRRAMVFMLPTAVLLPIPFLLARAALPIWAGLSLHLAAFFVCSMVCHGELAKSRPSTRSLTDFYLMLSLGGVLGGVFNAILAPMLFTRTLEYPLVIVLACLLCPPRSAFAPDSTAQFRGVSSHRTAVDIALALFAGICAWIVLSIASSHQLGIQARFVGLIVPMMLCVRLAGKRLPFAIAVASLLFVAYFFPSDRAHLLEMRRSFFGLHRIVRSDEGSFNELFHGTTLHGRQHIDPRGEPDRPEQALTYYHQSGPLGDIMSSLPANGRRDVGIIGLGIGSIAAYARNSDNYTFFEIDPVVRWAAEDSKYFSYIRSAHWPIGGQRIDPARRRSTDAWASAAPLIHSTCSFSMPSVVTPSQFIS